MNTRGEFKRDWPNVAKNIVHIKTEHVLDCICFQCSESNETHNSNCLCDWCIEDSELIKAFKKSNHLGSLIQIENWLFNNAVLKSEYKRIASLYGKDVCIKSDDHTSKLAIKWMDDLISKSQLIDFINNKISWSTVTGAKYIRVDDILEVLKHKK